jgi:hypothetical protein
MDLLDQPLPFAEAVQHLLAKDALPTGLSSAELAQLPAALRRQSFFSARTLLSSVLDKYQTAVASMLQPETIQRPDRVTPENPQGNVTVGLNAATARAKMKSFFGEIGYQALPGEEGTIKDLSSDGRIDLVVKTNVQLAQGAGQFIQGNASQDVVDLYPAWELVRYEDREVPRGEKRQGKTIIADPGNDWPSRFEAACAAAGDDAAAAVLQSTGRMVALKSSGVWQALGDGAGGHDDGLGNPYPPFAFNSGMWTEDVSRADCVELGLIDAGQAVAPAAFDLASLFKEAA